MLSPERSRKLQCRAGDGHLSVQMPKQAAAARRHTHSGGSGRPSCWGWSGKRRGIAITAHQFPGITTRSSPACSSLCKRRSGPYSRASLRMQGVLLQQRLASASLASCSGRSAVQARPAAARLQAARQRRLGGTGAGRGPTQLRAVDDDKFDSLVAPPGGRRRVGGGAVGCPLSLSSAGKPSGAPGLCISRPLAALCDECYNACASYLEPLLLNACRGGRRGQQRAGVAESPRRGAARRL